MGHFLGRRSQIYNLCSERAYRIDGLFDIVERFPFDDHNPCALKMIEKFCASVDAYLNAHPDNVVGIHCKAGKGRTGMLISAYLLHSAVCITAVEALEWFSRERTTDNKGVMIPSQIRYVHYYESMLRSSEMTSFSYQIIRVRFNSVPNFDPAITGGGCDPYMVVKVLLKQHGDAITWKKCTVFNEYVASNQNVDKYYPEDKIVDLSYEKYNIVVSGDVNVIFFDHDTYSSDEKMFHVWINTAFIESNYLCFEKAVIDSACKDKRNLKFDPNFKVEIFFRRVEHNVFNHEGVDEEEKEGNEDDSAEDEEEDV